MANIMITRKFFLLAVTAVASLYLVQGTSCIANDKSQFSGTVGSASLSASTSLKADLEMKIDDSHNLKTKPEQKAVPEPVCRDHHDLDKTLIMGGSEILPM